MRPAREGRENGRRPPRPDAEAGRASMRPAREGRENIHEIDVPNMKRVVLQ